VDSGELVLLKTDEEYNEYSWKERSERKKPRRKVG
jgi:hypothetical protein